VSDLLHTANAVAHVVEHHHPYARRALPYIVPLLARVAGFHGKRNAKLGALCEAGNELAETLQAHFDEEEQVLFPALLAAPPGRNGRPRPSPRPCGHPGELARLLAQVHSLADGYTSPEWADLAYRALMEELEALEEDVTEYLHLETFVLIPRIAAS
jgi:regulator of cell morphogenesis and NO signaling